MSRVLIVCPTEYYDQFAGTSAMEGQGREMAAAVGAGWVPVLLTGDVTEEKLADKLRDGCDGFWFVGHATGGEKGGLILSDDILPASVLGLYLARTSARWAYLNGCDSASLVVRIQEAAPELEVLANITEEIGDKIAARNGVLLAESLADGRAIREAYRLVVSGTASSLRFFPAPFPGGQSVQSNDIERRLQRLERIVLGDGDIGYPSWVEQTAKINSRMKRIEYGLAIATVLLMVVAIALYTGGHLG